MDRTFLNNNREGMNGSVRPIGIPDVPIVKDETPVTIIRTSKGMRYINDAQVLCKEEG